MNRIDLNEKVAVITGGAQGIGLAIAERSRSGFARRADSTPASERGWAWPRLRE